MRGAARFAEEVLGVKLLRHQKRLLERLDGSTGFRIPVMRQGRRLPPGT